MSQSPEIDLLRRWQFFDWLPDRNSRSYDLIRNVIPPCLVVSGWALLLVLVISGTWSETAIILIIAAEIVGFSLRFAPEVKKRTSKSERAIFAEIDNRIRSIKDDLENKHVRPVDFLLDELHEILIEILNSTSAALSSEIGASCAVCIKLLRKGTAGEARIRTFLRDARSLLMRSVNDKNEGYLLDANSAFASILFDPKSDGYFAKDNLRAAAASGTYVNGNERWRELYNATAVISLPAKYPKSGNVIGFLCVDCWFGDLTGVRVREILEIGAERAYDALGLILLVEQKLSHAAV